MTRIDFVIGNARHHVAAALPVIRELDGRVPVRVLSLCELRGQETPAERLAEAGAEVVRLVSRRVSREGAAGTASGRVAPESWLRAAVQTAAWWALVRWGRAWRGGRPAAAVLPNDAAFPYDRIAGRLRRAGVPFVLLQEGIRFELPGESDGARYGQGGAAAVAAWCPVAAGYFERVGVPPERVHAVGNPHLDALAGRANDGEADALLARLGVEGPYVLYASNTLVHQGFCTQEEKVSGFEAFLRHAEPYVRASGHRLVVKLHTGEVRAPFDRAVAACPYADRVTLCQDAPIYPLIERALAVTVLASTVGLEAMLLDRPVGLFPIPTVGHADVYAGGEATTRLDLDGRLPLQLRELAVGCLTSQKDYTTLLRAFAKTRCLRPARLVMLGEGRLRGELEALADSLEVGGAVDFAGFKVNPFPHMRHCAVYVLSSRVEGLPGALIQALACGAPSVSTDCPSGPDEILEPDENGLLVPVGDVDALANAMGRLLDDDKLRARFATRAPSSVARFGVDAVVRRYENALL